MGEERRRHSRVPGPFDGTFGGAAGYRDVRIVDLSLGGCFLDMLSPSRVGEAVTIGIRAGEHRVTLQGQVVYIDKVQGFAVKFVDSDESQLQILSEILRTKTG
jgi:hypothetical protein